MKLEKTNIQGFMKDPKSGVIHNTDLTKIEAMKESRRRYKEQKTFESRITELEKKIQRLEHLVGIR